MKYIVLSSTCSKEKYDEIYRTRTRPILDSSQKFFLSMISGLSTIPAVEVYAISELPVSLGCYKKILVKEQVENTNGIKYCYVSFINIPVIKTICTYFHTKKEIQKYLKDNDDDVIIICDALSLPMSLAARKWKKKVLRACVVTDLPLLSVFHISNPIKRLLYKTYNWLTQTCITDFDAYIELVEKMDAVVNPQKKPSLVIECILSSDYSKVDESPNSDIPHGFPPSIMYAGKIHAEFGIQLLVDSMKHIKNNCVIDIYGEGYYKDQLIELSKQDERIRIHDAVTVDEVVQYEKNSSILVNPRTSEGEFTQYSFPSKTVEYMMTGVPTVMFHLPGIPHEYDNYLNYAMDETAVGLANAIDTVLLNYSVAKDKALKGKAFVINEKNYETQANKIHRFLADS